MALPIIWQIKNADQIFSCTKQNTQKLSNGNGEPKLVQQKKSS